MLSFPGIGAPRLPRPGRSIKLRRRVMGKRFRSGMASALPFRAESERLATPRTGRAGWTRRDSPGEQSPRCSSARSARARDPGSGSAIGARTGLGGGERRPDHVLVCDAGRPVPPLGTWVVSRPPASKGRMEERGWELQPVGQLVADRLLGRPAILEGDRVLPAADPAASQRSGPSRLRGETKGGPPWTPPSRPCAGPRRSC
jgi:hypothetical protein